MAHLLIYACGPVGSKMAGPAIRAWEFARALSCRHQVTLISQYPFTGIEEGFPVLHIHDPQVSDLWKSADWVITQVLTPALAYKAWRHQTSLLIDAYDPSPLEVLEIMRQSPIQEASLSYQSELQRLSFGFSLGSAYLCASEKQRDLWLGFFLNQNLISPHLYRLDSSLRSLIGVVPFGLNGAPPQKTAPGLKEKYGFKETDRILIWGGGIWNWFDPLTLIRAMKLLSKTRGEFKLVFMGTQTPDPAVSEMSMCREAIHLATSEGLLNSTVFFNEGWVPYHERQNFLLDASFGVSTHFDHLETRYSFRTRILDYIWAGLPIISTEGDSFADLIRTHDLGIVVPYQDVAALAKAVVELSDDVERRERIKKNLSDIKESFVWDRLVEPIDLIMATSPSPLSFWQVSRSIAKLYWPRVKQRGLTGCLEALYKKLFTKSG